MAEDARSSQDAGMESPANDLLRVREILFGEQMQWVDQKFREHETRFQALEAALAAQEERLVHQQQEAEARLHKQLEDLRELLSARIEALDHKSTARATLGDLLIEMGQRLQQDGD